MIFRLKDRFGLLTMHTPIRRCLQALNREPSCFRSFSVAAFSNHNISSSLPIFTNSKPTYAFGQWYHSHYFSTYKQDEHIKKADLHEEMYDEEEEYYEDDYVSISSSKKVYTDEEKEAESTAIGYKVVGPLQKDDQVFKPYEPAFAVVQIGSHQFKVGNGDSIFTERLKFCEVNDKLILNKVLPLGSASQTIIGRPIVPDAAVHAVVEEHALDAKVIIFKKKRRKNYRRTKGHRQELTKLKITDIEGVEKPQIELVEKPSKSTKKEQETKMKIVSGAITSFQGNTHFLRNLSTWSFQGNGSANHQVNKSESPEEFEQRISSPRGNSKSDAILDKLNRQQQARTRDRSAGNSQMLDDPERSFDTLSDGMDGKLNNAARYFEFDPNEIDKDDYSFRYDTTFHQGSKYNLKALDARVIIFKKKRRKNYRRTKGHRQELTKLKITDIEGVEKPQIELVEKPSKSTKKEQETKMKIVSGAIMSFQGNTHFLRNLSTWSFQGSENDLPLSFDWRDYDGVLTPSRNQGNCGSCWTFSITHAIQSALRIYRGLSVKLSKQELLDCCLRLKDGSGWLHVGYHYIFRHGIALEKVYQYESHQNSCYRPCRSIGTRDSRIYIKDYVCCSTNERDLMKAVLKQPVSVYMCAGVELVEYKKGQIFDKRVCHIPHPTLPEVWIRVDSGNHCVLLVGYGSRNGVDYWIVQNSWGRYWGDEGFFLMKRSLVRDGGYYPKIHVE